MLKRFPSLCLGVAFLTAAAPRVAAAQTPPASPREGMGVAVVLTTQLFAGPVLSVRFTKPVAKKVAFDFDVGWTLRRARSRLGAPSSVNQRAGSPSAQTKWRVSGLVGGARMRVLPAGRSETGWSGAMSLGATVMHSGIFSGTERVARVWAIAPDMINVTLDKLSENGFRVGGSVGGVTSVPIALRSEARKRVIAAFESESQFPMFYASLFGAGVQR